jgi:hypothetical protein
MYSDKPFNMIDNHNSDGIERMLIVPRYTEAQVKESFNWDDDNHYYRQFVYQS